MIVPVSFLLANDHDISPLRQYNSPVFYKVGYTKLHRSSWDNNNYRDVNYFFDQSHEQQVALGTYTN